MSDKITWFLDADSSRVKAEMNQAVRDVQQGSRRMVDSFGSVESSHGNLLRGSHKVSKQITHMGKDFIQGAGAADILAGSLEGIAKSLNISLGSLVGLGMGALVVTKIGALREEYASLRKEVEKVYSEAGTGGKNALEEQAKKAEAAVKSLQETIGKRYQGGIGGAWQSVKDFITGAGDSVAPSVRQEASRETAQIALDKARQGLTGARERDLGIRADKLGGASDAEISARKLQAAFDDATHAIWELDVATKELSMGFKEIAAKTTEKHKERAGMTLSELASVPDVVGNDVSYERWKAGQDAKRAMSLDAQGEASRLAMQPEAAHSAFNQAGAIKEGITDLKPSEQMSADFKGALVVTEGYLKQLVDSKVVLVNR